MNDYLDHYIISPVSLSNSIYASCIPNIFTSGDLWARRICPTISFKPHVATEGYQVSFDLDSKHAERRMRKQKLSAEQELIGANGRQKTTITLAMSERGCIAAFGM
jgi:hypothetical protein